MDVRRVTRFATIAAALCLGQGAARAQIPSVQPTTAQPTTGLSPLAVAPQSRMRWQDFVKGPDGAKRLASLQKAIAKMKSLNSSAPTSADFRRSWQYWANIHGYYGPQSADGTVAQQISYLQSQNMGQFVKYYQGITDQNAPDAIAKAIWATCQHSPLADGSQANFFGWHRMYLYYYERVLRWAAQDNTLRLPYWDYTDPSQEFLPKEFRRANASIFDAKRNPRVNAGLVSLNPNATNINSFLTNPNYLAAESAVEQGVHGYVHCTVGPTCPVAHMGDVPVAGNDPVFYSHHANIDRMWACWQQIHGSKPIGQAWENQQFSFVDENGTMQTRPVKDFLNSTTLGYVYDNVADCARRPLIAAIPGAPVVRLAATVPTEPAPPAAPAAPVTVHTTGGVAVTSPTTSVDLNPPRPAMVNAFAAIRNRGAMEVVLHDVVADTPPGTLLDVFLSVKGDPGKRQQIGTISWFGAFNHHRAGHTGATARTLTFDITSAVRALGGADLGLVVVFEASSGLVPADRTQTSVLREEAQRSFRPEANVRIGSIELRTVPSVGGTP